MEASALWTGGPAALRCAVHAADGDAPPARIERWYRDDAPLHLAIPTPGTWCFHLIVGLFKFVAFLLFVNSLSV